MSKRTHDETSVEKGKLTHNDLFDACAADDLETVKRAIGQGLDLNATDNEGYTPLFLALLFDHPRTAKELIKQRQVDVNKAENDGWTPLHVACRNNQLVLTQELITHGADINRPDKDGWTPLHFACNFSNNIKAVEYLISQGADTHKPTKSGSSPFRMAYNHCNVSIARCLANYMKIEEIRKHLSAHSSRPSIDSMLRSILVNRYNITVSYFLFGQRQSNSPLSVLHRDLLQDIQKVIKEKIFL